MPLVTLSDSQYTKDAITFADQLKCTQQKAENTFNMNDLGRLDLHTETGVKRQIDSLKTGDNKPFYFDSNSFEIIPGNKTIESSGAHIETLFPDQFIRSIRHYFSKRIEIVLNENKCSMKFPSSVLGSHFFRIISRDIADLNLQEEIQVQTTQDILECIDERKKEIELNPRTIKDLLGDEISHNDILLALKRFGYTFEESSDVLRVKIPFNRIDIISENDVIEDIMLYFLKIFHGGDAIQLRTTDVFDHDLIHQKEKEKQLVELLTNFGFKEIKTSVLKRNGKQKYQFREDILISTMEYEHTIQNTSQPHKIFELGSVTEENCNLKNHLGIYEMSGDKIDFNELFSTVYHLITSVFGKDIHLKKTNSEKYREKMGFDIYIEDQCIGNIGFISDDVKRSCKVRNQVVYAEIHLESLT